jgi:hypothetical protein
VGQYVAAGHFLGHSGSFIEVRLTPDWAYGVSNWRWGVNILRVFPWLYDPWVAQRDEGKQADEKHLPVEERDSGEREQIRAVFPSER